VHKAIQFKIRGVSPLLLHNGNLGNPMNPIAKAMKQVSSKRKKTDDDFVELARLEWLGSLYLNDKKQPSIPGELIEAMMTNAAKRSKTGKDFTAGLICDGVWPIQYSGSKDPDTLWNDESFRYQRMVRVQMARVLRTRPMFRQWELDFTVHYLPDILNDAQVREAMVTAGRIIGLGDYRPKFGRFDVV
jgi:hypothetical protein